MLRKLGQGDWRLQSDARHLRCAALVHPPSRLVLGGASVNRLKLVHSKLTNLAFSAAAPGTTSDTMVIG